MTDRNLRVLVVDDHQVVHWGLRLMLGRLDWVERVVPASSGDQAAEFARRYEPHVALVDLFVGEESGPEIVGMIRTASPATRALLYSGAGKLSAKAARAAGAHGFITKERDATELADAIRRVQDDDAVFSPRLAGFVLDAFSSGPAPPTAAAAAASDADLEQLTPREREVLRHIARGYLYKEIAQRLGISVKTVEAHVSAVLRKLQLSTRHELSRWAVERRLVD